MEIIGEYNLYTKIEKERVMESGIIIPDMVVLPSNEYECVVTGAGSMVDVGHRVLALNINELDLGQGNGVLLPHENIFYNLSMDCPLPSFSLVKWIERPRKQIILPESYGGDTQRVEILRGIYAGKVGIIRSGRVLDFGENKFVIDNDDIVMFDFTF